MTPSKILFFLCISFIIGIFLSSILQISQVFIWVFLFVGVLVIIFGFLPLGKGWGWVVGFCILFFCLGILRLQISQFNIAENKLIKLNDIDQTITFIGTIVSEPDNRDTIQKIKFLPENFNGLILVTKTRYPEYNYLDKIKITGKIKTPGKFSDEVYSESYKNYLLKDGVYSTMDFAKIELLSSKHDYNIFNWTYEKILFVKQKLRENIRQNYSPPASLIMEGTILGDNGALSDELKNQLNITGLRHVIAVSGTHVIILSVILLNLFLLVGFWRGQAFYGCVILIWLYIVLTGFPASGVRAGIMITLLLLAQKLGRQAGGLRVVVIAGAVILGINPLLLFYDVGFQLSFLAVLGLIYLDQFIKNSILKIAKIKNNSFEKFVGMFSATISAQIFTVPVMLYNFGNVSLIAPITNLLVLPAVEPLMIFGFLSAFFGLFFGPLGFILSIPCQILLIYFIKILKIFSAPWAMKVFENVHWAWLVILYFVIGLFVAWVRRKERENNFY